MEQDLNLIMKNRIRQSFKKFIFLFIVFIIALGIIPIKHSITSEDKIKNDSYYIISLIPEGSTDSGDWICYDQDGLKYKDVIFEGKLPQNILSADVYMSGTTFVIYGKLVKESNFYILQSENWDILYNVNRNCDSLRIDFNRFITIFDLKYFDFFLSGYNEQ
ncbi:MAG: hypothetical protein J6A57_00275 [Ruminococcus sp.]|nr:hypothetical protein [Ruminococcus sp.]